MEEVDNIIFNSLRECGCDFAEEMTSLSQLSTENVVEAAVRCLKIINTDLKVSHSLPPGMSARFRVGTTLAQACQSAGYRGDIGYQTFLYSSEADVRKLFMFLVEKLPRKKDESVDQPSGKSSALGQNVARVLKKQLASMWLPSYCKKNGIRWSQDEFFMEGARGRIPFHADPLILPHGVGKQDNPPSKALLEYYQRELPYAHEQLSSPEYLVPSLMERNVLELSRQQEWENLVNDGTMGSQISPQEYREQQLAKLEKDVIAGRELVKNHKSGDGDLSIGGLSLNISFEEVVNQLSKKSSITAASAPISIGLISEDASKSVTVSPENISRTNLITDIADNEESAKPSDAVTVENHVGDVQEQKVEAKETEEERIKRIEKELKKDLRETVERMEKMELEIHEFQEIIIGAKEEMLNCEQSNKTVQEKVKLQKKTLQLLPDAEDNITKLEEMVEANKTKMVGLEQQWDKHRVPLQEKYDHLKQELSQKETQSERKMREVKLVRQRIKENTEEMKRKEQLEKQLAAQCAEVTVDVPRKLYTKRIFEIVANIRKQKQEIERVLIDVKTLQKEINQLEGRAERTFTAADDLFYKDAGSDADVRQAYKYLVSLNINCSQLLDTVEQTGEVMREIKNLEEQVADESKKNTASNLEKITKDFKAMKKENTEMVKKLKSLTTSSPKPRKKK